MGPAVSRWPQANHFTPCWHQVICAQEGKRQVLLPISTFDPTAGEHKNARVKKSQPGGKMPWEGMVCTSFLAQGR